jgi:hypothetical protein
MPVATVDTLRLQQVATAHRPYSMAIVNCGFADAPDLGFRNRRFQNVPFRFKRQSIYEGKTRFFTFRVAFTIGE